MADACAWSSGCRLPARWLVTVPPERPLDPVCSDHLAKVLAQYVAPSHRATVERLP